MNNNRSLLCIVHLVLLMFCETAAAQETVWKLDYHPFRTVGGIDTHIIGILKDGDRFLTRYYDEALGVTSLHLRDYATGNLIRTVVSHNRRDPNISWLTTHFQQDFDRIMIKWQTLETTEGGASVRFTDQYHFSFIEAHSGKQISKWSLRCAPNEAIFSGDGKLFAVATGESGQSELAIYDIQSGQRVKKIPAIDPKNSWDWGGPFMLSQKGDKLLVSEQYPDRPATHHVFDVTSLAMLQTWTARFRDRLPHESWLSPDGNTVIVENKLFDPAKGKERYSFPGSFLQFTDDSTSIVCVPYKEGSWSLVFLDVNTGRELKRISLPFQAGEEPKFQSSPKFRRYVVLEGLAKSESNPVLTTTRALIIDMNTGKVIYSGEPHIVAIAPDGRSFIQSTNTHYVRRNISP